MTNDNRFLIGFDMDGTLLVDHDKEISSKTAEYLKELTKQGHIIVLASGRPESELKYFHNQLGLTSPLACFNGIATFNREDKNFPPLLKTYPKEWAYLLQDDLMKIGWENAFCETNDDIWMYKKDDRIIDFMWPHGVKRDIHFGNFHTTLKVDPMTIILFKYNDLDLIEQTNEYVNKFPNAEIRYWFGKNIAEVTFGNGGKEIALEHIRKYYKIRPENTIAFGDFLNDIGMIKWAHHGVAMANAVDEVKKVADYVTKDDNNHDGIIATLKSIIESNS